MTFRNFSRLFTAALMFTFILAACSSSDETAEPDTTNDSTTTTSTTEAETADDSETTDSAVEVTTTTVDERTSEEIAIDQLDLMLVQLRTVDLVATADCVVDRLESEGIEIVGQGAPELIAALGCDPSVGTQLFAVENLGFSGDQGSCIVAVLIEEAAVVPLAEAETFFSAATPPDDVLQTIATGCGVPFEELQQGFGN